MQPLQAHRRINGIQQPGQLCIPDLQRRHISGPPENTQVGNILEIRDLISHLLELFFSVILAVNASV
jgi:hypothetical protein